MLIPLPKVISNTMVDTAVRAIVTFPMVVGASLGGAGAAHLLFFLALVVLQEIVHQRLAAALGQRLRARDEDLFGLDEIGAFVAPDLGMHVRVHADRIARTRLDAHAAVDAA